MTMSPDEFLMSGGVPSAKFPTPGTVVTGIVAGEPRVQQATDYVSGKPKTWPDGRPVMQMVVRIATDERDPDRHDDDGHRQLYISGLMQKVVRDAVRAAGASGIAKSGVLTVTYTHDGPPKQAGMNGAKQYTATYLPPASAPVAVPAEPAATAAAPTPAPVAPVPAGLNDAQIAAIAAAGL